MAFTRNTSTCTNDILQVRKDLFRVTLRLQGWPSWPKCGYIFECYHTSCVCVCVDFIVYDYSIQYALKQTSIGHTCR